MARRKKGTPVHGWVFLDKPLGLGSTQAVSLVKRLFNAQKAGHAGTLDPLATGLLAVALGEATKTVPYMMDADKAYAFTVKWGEATSTGDADDKAEIVATSDVRPSRAATEAALHAFTGEITQVPPSFSAVKVDGKRAYDLARAGEDVEIKPRQVRIERLTLVDCPDSDYASFEVVCSKGTYIRSLGRDLAEALGTRGHLSALRRTASGGVGVDEAVSPAALEAAGNPLEHLHPLDAVLAHMPRVNLAPDQVQRVGHGNSAALLPDQLAGLEPGEVLLLSDQQPLAIAVFDGRSVNPQRVFVFESA